MTHQNIMERIMDRVARGELSVSEANIQIILDTRIRVTTKLPASVRKVLNKAVKDGILGRLKKDGLKPEIYFHPNFDYLARSERNKIERVSIKNLLKIAKY